MTTALTVILTAAIILLAIIGSSARPADAWLENIHQDVCYKAWTVVSHDEMAGLNPDCAGAFVNGCTAPNSYWWKDDLDRDEFDDVLTAFYKKFFCEEGYLSSARLKAIFENENVIGYDRLGFDGNSKRVLLGYPDISDEEVCLPSIVQSIFGSDQIPRAAATLVTYGLRAGDMHGQLKGRDEYYYYGPALWEKILQEGAYGPKCGREFVMGVLMHNLQDAHSPTATGVSSRLASFGICGFPYLLQASYYFPSDAFQWSPDTHIIHPNMLAPIGWYGVTEPYHGFTVFCSPSLQKQTDDSLLAECVASQNDNNNEGICSKRISSVDFMTVGVGPSYEFTLIPGGGVHLPRGGDLGSYSPVSTGVPMFKTPVDISYRINPEETAIGHMMMKRVTSPLVMDASWVLYQTMLFNTRNYLSILANGKPNPLGSVGCVLGVGAKADPAYAKGAELAEFAQGYAGTLHYHEGSCSCTLSPTAGGGGISRMLDGTTCASPENCKAGLFSKGTDSVGFISAVHTKQNIPLLANPISQCITGDRVMSKEELKPGDIVCFEKTDSETGFSYRSPPIDCSSISKLPPQKLIERYENEEMWDKEKGWNSGITYKEAVEKYAKKYSMDPAIIAATLEKESTMGTNDGCTTKAQKSAATGCCWPAADAPPYDCADCYCDFHNKDSVKKWLGSQDAQLECTANVIQGEMLEALDGQDTGNDVSNGLYHHCHDKFTDESDRWNCALCTYVGDDSAGYKTCGYADNVKTYYCHWKNYYSGRSSSTSDMAKLPHLSASPAIYLGREGPPELDLTDAVMHSNGQEIIVQSFSKRANFLWGVRYLTFPLVSGENPIVTEAKRYLGTCYDWGAGCDLDEGGCDKPPGRHKFGVDCSGFVNRVLSTVKATQPLAPGDHGDGTPGICDTLVNTYGGEMIFDHFGDTATDEELNKLRPGDVIVFRRGGHIGFWLGKANQMDCDGVEGAELQHARIHASGPNSGDGCICQYTDSCVKIDDEARPTKACRPKVPGTGVE